MASVLNFGQLLTGLLGWGKIRL